MTFNVTVLPSGRSFPVNDGETVLSASINLGLGLAYGCKSGSCGSCKCKMLEGEVIHAGHHASALSTEEEASGLILACCAQPQTDLVLESRHVTDESALRIKRMPVRVQSLQPMSHDVMALILQLPTQAAFEYHAGQYVEFLLRDGHRRAYSIANAPHTQSNAAIVELHIRHMPGGKFTSHVFGGLKEREIFRIEGPFGNFFLREESDRPIILLASGTGFAPIKALIEHMKFRGICRPVVLYWGGRRPSDLYMNEWIEAQRAAFPNLRYIPVVSDALKEDFWTGRTGFVHNAVTADFPDLSGHQVYACGAPIVVDSARAAYLAAGLPEDEFFADSFVTEKERAQPGALITA